MEQQPSEQPVGQQPVAQPTQQPVGPSSDNGKKKNNSLIVIIVAVLVALIAGVSVYFILRGNGGESGNNSNSSQEEQSFANPADEDAAYIINIDGKTFTYKNKLKDLEEVGLYVSDSVKDETVKAGKYVIMFAGGRLSNTEKNISLRFMPYNDGTEDVKLPDAKLGTVTVSLDTNEAKNDIYSQWTFYGGIHLGSTEEELLEVYGEPYDKSESENYKGEMKTTYKFRGSSYQNFEFAVIDGKVTEMSWTNYGSLADR